MHNTTIFDCCLILCRLLVELTTPLEDLFGVDEFSQTREGIRTIFTMKQHLSDLKDVFLEKSLTKVIIGYIEMILAKVSFFILHQIFIAHLRLYVYTLYYR